MAGKRDPMMQQFLSRLTALLCAAAMVITLLPLPAAAEGEVLPTPSVSVDSVTVQQGSSITVYVRGHDLVDLYGLSLSILYDHTRLTLISSSLMNMTGSINLKTPGRIQISTMSETPLTGSYQLMRLVFQTTSDTPAGTYPLELVVSRAYHLNLQEIVLGKTSGSITVKAVQTIPQASFSLYGDSSVKAGERLTLKLYSSDLEQLVAGQFSFTYDSTLLRFESISMLPSMSVADATLTVNTQNRGLAVAAFMAAAPAKTGYLMDIVFTALEDGAGATTVTCQPTSLYSNDLNPIQAAKCSRSVTIYPAEIIVQLPTLTLTGQETLLTNGSVTLAALLDGSSALGAADFVISYDPALLRCVSVEKAADDSILLAINPKFQQGEIVFSVMAPQGITQDTPLVTFALESVVNRAERTTVTPQVFDAVDADIKPVALTLLPKTIQTQVPSFSVTFVDHDDTVLAVQQVPYLSDAAAPAVLGKPADAGFHYVHSGWDGAFTEVSSDLTVRACYDSVAHTFEQAVWTPLDDAKHVRTCTGCTATQTGDHRWDEGQITTAAQCTTTGVRTFTCEDCSGQRTEILSALDHNWDEGTVTTAPTCTADGVLTKSCSRCTAKQTSVLPATGHTPAAAVEENRIAATCATAGQYETVVYCAVCSQELSRTTTVLAVVPHTPGAPVQQNTVAPTCTAAGSYDLVTLCTGCGGELSRTTHGVSATGHAFADTFTVDVPATCTTAGSESRHCANCSATTDVTVLPALDHNWDEGTVTTAPTCTADGVRTKACSRCPAEQTFAIPATGHDYADAFTVDVPATCTADGSKSRHCANCHSKTDVTAIPAPGHDWDEGTVTVPATCTVDGVRTHACANCDDTLEEAIVATGHDYADAFTVDLPATCTTAGSQSRHCANCDSKTDNTAIPYLGHDWNAGTVTTPATCTQAGVRTQTCSRCPEMQTSVIPATGHTADEAVQEHRTDSTCTTAGSYDLVVYCRTCGAEISRTEELLELLPHTPGEPVEEDTVDSTCTTAGSYDLVTYCTVCGKEQSRLHQSSQPHGHAYADAFTVDVPATCTTAGSKSRHCANCDSKTDVTDIPYLGHDWDDGTVTVTPTCTEAGVRTHSCANCTEKQTSVIPATGHTAGEAVQENYLAPSCTAAGSYDLVVCCQICREKLSSTHHSVDALGHTAAPPVEENRTDPTCTAMGGYDSVVYCTVCHQAVQRTPVVLDKLPHDYQADFTVDAAATCTAAGSKSRHCANCSSTTDETVIPPLTHDWQDGETRPATCTQEGAQTQVCSRCSITQTTVLPATGHTAGEAVQENYHAPSCTQKGEYDVAIYCQICSAQLERTHHTVSELGHTADEPTVEGYVFATCTKEGGYDLVIYCRVCSTQLERTHKTDPMLPHTYDADFTVDVPATCTTAGSKSRHCANCSSKTDITAIPNLNHDWDEGTVTAAPTCTLEGVHTQSCSRCDSIQTTVIPATGHTAGEGVQENYLAPSCTQKGGYDVAIYCQTCSTQLERTHHTISELGHTAGEPAEENRIDPTCTQEGGYDTVTLCATCHTLLNRTHTPLSPLNHDYAAEFTEDVPPTCTTAGSKSRHCSRCDSKTEITDLLPLGHRYQQPVFHWSDDLSGCQATVTCPVCPEGTPQKQLSLSCGITEQVITQATCTKPGQKLRIATIMLDDQLYSAPQPVELPLTDHLWSPWTADDMNTHSRTCTDCTAMETLSHNWSGHSCPDCGQADSYAQLQANTLTVFAANLPAKARILVAGYSSTGKLLYSVVESWDEGTSLPVELPAEQNTDAISVFLLSENWEPLRAPLTPQ